MANGLRKWVAEKWVDIGARKKDGSYAPCGRSKGEKRKGYPKCVPLAKARAMPARQERPEQLGHHAARLRAHAHHAVMAVEAVMEKTLQRDPELCRAIVKASTEGWRYAFAHPEESLDVVMRNLRKEYIPATRVHQKWMLARMKDLILSEGFSAPMGRLAHEDYDRVARGLQSNGLIEGIPPFHEFYNKCHEE